MKKYFIITFGCQQNKSDSERIASILEKNNYKPASSKKEADLIIVNSCSIRQSAIDRLRGLAIQIKKIKKDKQNIKAVLTGCLLEKDRKKFKKYFDFILPIKTLNNWPEILKKEQSYPFFNQRDKDFFEKNKIKYLNINPKRENHFSASIPISSGCNNFCTYCVVPYTRGPLICRDHKKIIKEAKKAIKNGAKEIWLLGENVNDYQSPTKKKIKFPKLLEKIDKLKGDFWIRFISPHPKNFSQKLINQIPKIKKLAKHLHIPVQSGNNEILKKMNRSYTVQDYKKIIKQIRNKVSNITISTDVIVGFPGETKKQFKDTVKLFKEIKFDMAYIAKYSTRKGTKAAQMKDDISLEEKERRRKELNKILEKTALNNNKKYKNKEVKVLIKDQSSSYLFGKTSTYKTVKIKKDKITPVGAFKKVKIKKITPWGLKGEVKPPKLIVILGPTASGKTSLSIKLANKFNGEIISADSKQVYKEIGIGTAKPTKKEREKAQHHLVDCVSLNEEFNVAIYKKMALTAIKKVLKKGKTPFLVGGSPLYVKSVVKDFSLGETPPNKKLREKLEKKNKKELFKIYQKLDPEGAKKIKKKNKRRLVRAIEVCKETGESFWKQRKKKDSFFDVLKIGLKPNQNKLKERISKRTDQMFKKGLEEEAIKALKKFKPNPRLKAIGYQEWFSFYPDFKVTEKDREKIKEKIKLHTMQFSKRQMTWYKKDKEINWVKNYQEAEKLIKRFIKD